MSSCLDANRALDFVDGRLDHDESEAVETHVSECDDCRAMIAQLVRDDAASPAGDDGDRIGRYRVREQLGSGGMGVVFRAYDPQLERDVAIKLLHISGGSGDTDAARSRLLREARSLARLAHPNVVAVHDVGVHENDVFVAMELVRGQSLRQWLDEDNRSTRDIVDAFVAAGRGLAAAHNAGLIHRDFKPDNVMMGDDGRARVVDFGLVLPTGSTNAPSAAAVAADSDEADLTGTGFTVGTPRYMAPEQHLGEPVDPRCDQFSFCVALYEALFGHSPYAGDSPRARTQQVIAGRARAPQRPGDVPLHVREAVLRGLRAAPDDRHASMDALLAILARPPRRPLVWVAAAAAVLAVAAGSVFIGMRSSADHPIEPAASPASQLCRGGDQRFTGIWDDEVRTGIRARFDASGRRSARHAFAAVARALDRYRADWLRMRRESCEATRVYGTQTVALMDRRSQCLERSLLGVRGLTRLLRDASPAAVDKADVLVRQLDTVDGCADRAVLDGLPRLPADPGARAALRSAVVTMDVAAHLITTGDYRGALSRAIEVAKTADKYDFKPLLARAHYVMGEAQRRVALLPGAEKSLMKAAQLAAETKNDRLAAIVWSNLILLKGHQYKLAEALRMAPMARAAVTRDGNRPRLRANFLSILASVHLVNGDTAKAIALFEETLALQRKAYGDQARPVAATLINLAAAFQTTGRLDAAAKAAGRASEIVRAVLGDDHPYMAQVHYTVGRIHRARNQLIQAAAAFRSARQIRERILGANHPLVAAVIERQADVLAAQGELARADRALGQALAIKSRVLGNDHPLVANVFEQRGLVLFDQGKHAQALAAQTRALDIRRRAFGERSVRVVRSLVYVAETAARMRRQRLAREHFERALAIAEPNASRGLVTARVKFGLARLLYSSGNRRRAVRLANEARRGYAAAGAAGQDQLAAVDMWLARR